MQKNKVLLKKKKYHQIPTKSPDSKALQQKKTVQQIMLSVKLDKKADYNKNLSTYHCTFYSYHTLLTFS